MRRSAGSVDATLRPEFRLLLDFVSLLAGTRLPPRPGVCSGLPPGPGVCSGLPPGPDVCSGLPPGPDVCSGLFHSEDSGGSERCLFALHSAAGHARRVGDALRHSRFVLCQSAGDGIGPCAPLHEPIVPHLRPHAVADGSRLSAIRGRSAAWGDLLSAVVPKSAVGPARGFVRDAHADSRKRNSSVHQPTAAAL